MKKLKLLLVAFILGAMVLGLSACAGSKSSEASAETQGAKTTEDEKTSEENKESVTIKIGVVGENNELWDPVIENLAKEGIKIELVKFADYTLPNQALADGEIDLNAFQHYAYLNNAIKEKGYEISSIGETIIAPLGFYSNKIKDVKEIKEGATIAIPNDVVNGGRSLKVLEVAGLIKVSEESGFTPAVSDITENPLNIKFYEVEASNTASLLPDVTGAFINGGHAIDNGLNPITDSILLEKVGDSGDNPYINIIAARTADKDNANYKKVVEAYRTDEVAKIIEEAYKGAYIPTWK